HEFTRHQLTPSNTTLNGAWNQIFAVIGAANSVIDSFESSPQAENLKAEIAEVRAMRAYAYFFAMDLFGNVPIFTESRVDPQNLPSTNQRTEVFDFIVSELEGAISDLPSITEVNRTEYYPRYTKESGYAILAITFLNGEVYTGNEYWDEAIAMSDNIINSGGYILEPEFISSFTTNNHNSQELIAAASIDPAQNAGNNVYLRGASHPRHQITYDLPFTPANGYKSFFTAVERYEDEDVRKQYMVYGLQYDGEGNPLTVSDNDDTHLELVPIVDYQSVAHNEGARVLKYIPDGNWVGRSSSNDIPFIRYSEILLTKAEALYRSPEGSNSEALALLNEVRTRSNATELSEISLEIIENERAREFIWEGQRRRDMIRFGSYFTGTWKFKTEETPEYRGIYPIPQNQIQGNDNLIQNPGY
ncbi:MAG: RagB/SusD family nutrient uptake outer membrane protein, partial [Balneolales bacterium]